MEWDLLYILQMIQPRTFQELTTKAHDMKMTIANCSGKASPAFEIMKEEGNVKKKFKFSKSSTKELMSDTDLTFRKIKSRGKAMSINERCWKEASYFERDSRKEVPIS